MNFTDNILPLIKNKLFGEPETIYIAEFVSLIALAFTVFFLHKILKGTLLKGIEKLTRYTTTDWDDKLYDKGVFNKVILILPWILGQLTLPYFIKEDSGIFFFALKAFKLGLLIQFTLIINQILKFSP